MKAVRLSRLLSLLLGAGLVLAACSDSEPEAERQRPLFLDRAPGLIVADALSETPSPEFKAVRSRVVSGVAKERRDYTRGFALVGGRAPALVADPTIAQARRSAAMALGVGIDEQKANDVALASASLEALLAELHKRFPGAASCDAAGPKADDCAIALLVLEVQRSEQVAMSMDGGITPLDDGSVAADGGGSMLPDGGEMGGDAAVDASMPGPVTAFECGARDVTGAREVTGTLMASETWSGKVLVKGPLYVRGATITIMPGTQVFMDVDSSLQIGWSSDEGAIIADGTEAAPIRICGKVADQGYWNGVVLGENVTSNSVLRNVLVADGAGDGKASVQLNAPITVDNLQVRNAQHSGVSAVDFSAGSQRLSVDGTAGPAVVLTDVGAVTRFPLGGSFSANSENVARVSFTQLQADTVVHNIGIPYLQETTVYTGNGASLTFEAGVEYRVQPGAALEVGWSTASAGLYVAGTAAAPVLFRGASDVSANWTGLHVGANVTTDSHLMYAELRQAGGAARQALDLNSPVRIDHVTLRGNATGVGVGEAGLAASSTALTVTDTASYPLVVQADGIYGLPTGGMLTGNMLDQVKVEGSTVTRIGTVNNLGIPYLLTSTLYLNDGTAMTIAPGTAFLFGAGASLQIGWGNGDTAFIAEGTALAPITFTGLDSTAGFWGSIVVGANVRTSSKLNYLHIGHGGRDGAALLEMRANIPVTNSRFFDSAGYGIEKAAANVIDYTATNTFENVALGNVLEN